MIIVGIVMNWPEEPTVVYRDYANEKITLNEEGTEGEFVYNVTNSQNLNGHIFEFVYMNGSLNHNGGDLIVHYLNEEGFKIYKDVYGGDISRCPAPFLNAHMKTAMLIGGSEELSSNLQSIRPDGRKSGIPFAIEGESLVFDSAKMPDGRDLHMTFTMPIYKVNAISI